MSLLKTVHSQCCLCISVEGCRGVHAMQVFSAVTRMSGLVMLPAVYELWTGHSAFSGMSKLQIMAGVVSSGLRPKLPRDCPAWYSSLAAACWATSPTRRYVQCSFSCTASQFWLPWLNCCLCGYQCLNQLLQVAAQLSWCSQNWAVTSLFSFGLPSFQ